jgi:AAHS family 4-hydroxybenzoate transporter-like MFS transporter
MRNTQDLQEFIDTSPFSPFQWLIVGLCFTIILMDGFDTAAIGYIAPSLLHEWGLRKSDLGPVLSAALVGFAAGPLIAGPLADRIGRKKVLFGALLVFGAASLLAAFAADLRMLTVMRLFTGFGLGAAAPGAVALTGEFCPAKRRAMLTNTMFCAFPLGAAGGGFLAAWMIPLWGWRSVLLAGGIVPLLLALLLQWRLPESVRYLLARGVDGARVREILARIAPQAREVEHFVLDAAEDAHAPRGLAAVLGRSRLAGSVMLWIAYFMGLVIFYALINWMPILFKDAGMAPRQATLITALFPLGGIGAVAAGVLMDRFQADRVVAAAYALTAVLIYLIGHVMGDLGLLTLTVFAGGALMNTAQSSMPALAAAYYPTQGRAAGIGWMLGIGRFGGVAGSFLVGMLAARHAGLTMIFLIVAIPGLLAAFALEIKRALRPSRA